MQELPIVCHLDVLSETERTRRSELAAALRTCVQGAEELPNGYALRLDANSSIAERLDELIALEGKCCPFLQFELRVDTGGSMLYVTGPEGVKEFLASQSDFAADL